MGMQVHYANKKVPECRANSALVQPFKHARGMVYVTEPRESVFAMKCLVHQIAMSLQEIYAR